MKHWNRRKVLASLGALPVAARATTVQSTFGLTVNPTGPTFDYYISNTGSDSNPGTLASPWALTSLAQSQFQQFKDGRQAHRAHWWRDWIACDIQRGHAHSGFWHDLLRG